MVPNPEGQQLRLESVNALLSQPIHISQPLQLPPILSNQPTDTINVQDSLSYAPSSPPPPPSPSPPPPTQAPVPPPLPPDQGLPLPEFSWANAQFKEDMHFIDTKFAPELDINKKVRYKPSDEVARYDYTRR